MVYMTEGGGALLTVLVFGFNKWQNSLPFNKSEYITAGLDIHYELTKIICQQTRRATTIPRPPLESSWRGEFRSIRTIFVGTLFRKLSRKKRSKMDPTKMTHAYLNSPCRELSNGGLGIVVALLVRWGIMFLCAYF